MANELRDLRDRLLTLDHPDKLLRMADQYLSTYALMGETFVLPKEHALLRPIIEYYAGDLLGWLKFVRGVRDRLPPRSVEQGAVQMFYRTLDVRATQQSRRERITIAVSNAVKARAIADTPDAKQVYARRVVQAWSRQRYAEMDEARGRTVRPRLTTEERSEILEKFWEKIDEELSTGGFPQP